MPPIASWRRSTLEARWQDAAHRRGRASSRCHKPGLIVVLTDGEETCGGSPCDLSEKLHAEADQLTVNVVDLRVKNYAWMGDIRVSSTPNALLKRTVANTSRWIHWPDSGRRWRRPLGVPW